MKQQPSKLIGVPVSTRGW